MIPTGGRISVRDTAGAAKKQYTGDRHVMISIVSHKISFVKAAAVPAHCRGHIATRR